LRGERERVFGNGALVGWAAAFEAFDHEEADGFLLSEGTGYVDDADGEQAGF
jgi:hypothetical protein